MLVFPRGYRFRELRIKMIASCLVILCVGCVTTDPDKISRMASATFKAPKPDYKNSIQIDKVESAEFSNSITEAVQKSLERNQLLAENPNKAQFGLNVEIKEGDYVENKGEVSLKITFSLNKISNKNTVLLKTIESKSTYPYLKQDKGKLFAGTLLNIAFGAPQGAAAWMFQEDENLMYAKERAIQENLTKFIRELTIPW